MNEVEGRFRKKVARVRGRYRMVIEFLHGYHAMTIPYCRTGFYCDGLIIVN